MTATPQALSAEFDVPAPSDFSPRFNIAPTQQVFTITGEAERVLASRRWGLVPHWAADTSGAGGMINARVETVAEKPAFRDAFRNRRCLIPADGFYEWRAASRDKQPYHIALPDRALFAFAGLYERWRGEDDEIDSCTIVTTEARGRIRSLHSRMPVMLARDRYDAWLDPASSRAELRLLMETELAANVEVRAVARRVNSIRYDDAECLAPEAQLSLLPDDALGSV